MAVSAFLDRKLARRFGTYDVDGDGFIGRGDFELAATRMGEEFGLEPGSQARTKLTGLCLDLWERLARAAGRDAGGSISQAEYKAAFAACHLESPESFDAGYLPLLDAIMDIADTDRDGRLSRAEHERWTCSLMNVPQADARQIARRLDADGDGYISRSEILGTIRAYYFDEAPDSAGSWALGPLEPH